MKQWTLLLLSAMLFADVAAALPKFSARQGAKCQSCHINPGGKGMRSTFGAAFGREELTMPTFADENDFDEYSTALNDYFSVGMDFRTLFFYTGSNDATGVFQMQGDLYLDFRLNKQFRIYFDKGLYNGFEVFGLAKVLPMNGYIKAGNFIPSYGIRMDDHTLLIRNGSYFPLNPAIASYPQGLGFGQGSEDTGIEFGLSPGIFTMTAGVFNGRMGGLAGSAGSKTKAIALRADANIFTDAVNMTVGGSFYNLPTSGGPGKVQMWGGFGIFSLSRNLTILGEVDFLQSHNIALGKQVTGNILYTEANYLLFDGVDVKVGYEFYDPNIDVKDGSISRITVGAEFFPMTGVEVRPVYRLNTEEPADRSNNEFFVLFHYFL